MDLGDVALFVGDNHSISVIAFDFPGCQSNSIYFCQTHPCGYGGRLYVFSLDNNRTLLKSFIQNIQDQYFGFLQTTSYKVSDIYITYFFMFLLLLIKFPFLFLIIFAYIMGQTLLCHGIYRVLLMLCLGFFFFSN